MLSPLPCLAERTPWPGVDEGISGRELCRVPFEGSELPVRALHSKDLERLGLAGGSARE